MADLSSLLSPFSLRHLRLRNRVVSTSHAPAYAVDGMPKEQYRRYHEEKAKGGLALSMFGGSSVVSPECPASFGQLNLGVDSVIPYLEELADCIHRHGAATMCQISHMGRRSRWDAGDWLPNVAPSAIREPEHRSFPKAMESWDIDRAVRSFGEAARRCKEGQLDGVELSFANQHLISQFLSPMSNQRTDKYGGSFANRIRIAYEVLDSVRAAVGSEFIVGVRITGDELVRAGLSFDECIEVAVALAETGQVDFLNVMGGTPVDYLNLAVQIANMSFPVAPFLYLASGIKAEVNIPILQAQRLSDVATASRAISDGHLDLVGLVRPHMADPYLVQKLLENRAEDIRQCIGANYCIDKIYMGGQALCIQNAATGREATMPHVVEKSKGPRRRVVVVGGGPAGLEAARVTALRGHDVVLFETAERLGGQIRLAQRASWREALSGIPRWLEKQIIKLDVDIRLGQAAGVVDVLAESPDVVMVATGGRPNTGLLEAGNEYTVSSWTVLEAATEVGRRVLLFDDHGGHQGPACAEFLARKGNRVEVVTPERFLGVEVGGTNHPIHLRELYKLGVVITPDFRLVEVYEEGEDRVAVLENVYTLLQEERVVDTVIVEAGTLPDDELYFELVPRSRNGGAVDLEKLAAGELSCPICNPEGAFELYRIGDAVASRNIHAAIYDGLRYAKDL